MFKSIQEGLNIYREKLKEHFQETRRVAELERESREQQGIEYYGLIDWPKKEQEAFNERRLQLHGMIMALGLSDKEITKNREDVRAQLGMRR